MNYKKLLNKKILITCGPIWVPIDKVRVLTNVFGGSLGYLIAEKAHKMGAKVLLLMGPGKPFSNNKFKIIRIKYYKEIYKILEKEIKKKNYDIVIHSAAIPDYIPTKVYNGKIKSGNKKITIKLKPTIKIVDKMKKWDPNIFLVKFKLEVGKTRKELINIANKSLIKSNADLIVANDYNDVIKDHLAYIIDKNKNSIICRGKEKIADNLLNLLK
jgi:phosphopantothenoylcysteine synthetase/decarboxylase